MWSAMLPLQATQKLQIILINLSYLWLYVNDTIFKSIIFIKDQITGCPFKLTKLVGLIPQPRKEMVMSKMLFL